MFPVAHAAFAVEFPSISNIVPIKVKRRKRGASDGYIFNHNCIIVSVSNIKGTKKNSINK